MEGQSAAPGTAGPASTHRPAARPQDLRLHRELAALVAFSRVSLGLRARSTLARRASKWAGAVLTP
ncbi:hypothetical protein OG625_40160 (plasmid) [Streptomyces sp. NBC_01351]|uniref:hypothetical protein n=1 Tax=Streptomyces sp. NBC_01351 TaxID=2903833 RepID=UPI002E32ED53|nr:hypothetical protein [Streptomyces sp. NBC_01351]